MASVTKEQLEALRRMQSCAISNAIETFDVRPREQGFMSPEVRCMFPDMGGMIGYAVTAVIAAKDPYTSHMNVPRSDWFDEVYLIEIDQEEPSKYP